MKVLVLYDYSPSPGGLATQGDLLYRGLLEMEIDPHAVHFESAWESVGLSGFKSSKFLLRLASQVNVEFLEFYFCFPSQIFSSSKRLRC